MVTFYSAAGTYHLFDVDGESIPAIVVNYANHWVSPAEFAVWYCTTWKVSTQEEINENLRNLMGRSCNVQPILQGLVEKHLVLAGRGSTASEALFRLMGNAFLIPNEEDEGFLSKVKRKLLEPFRAFEYSAQAASSGEDQDKQAQKRVLKLLQRIPLTGAQVIRCWENNVTPDVDMIYLLACLSDCGEDGDMASAVKNSACTTEVIQAVCSLYCSKAIQLQSAIQGTGLD